MQGQVRDKETAEGSPFRRHILALDGVRGLAVLGVAGSHLFPGTPHSAVQSHIQSALKFGASGVDLFFVLSGFLITGILYDTLHDPAYFSKFYARRALRIFPLYYGVLIAFAIAAYVGHLAFHNELVSLALYLQNTSWIGPPIAIYTGPSELPLAHFWSLAVEEQFYLVWPVTLFLLRKKRPLLLFCGAAMVLCPLIRMACYRYGMGYVGVNTNTLCRADSLLAGAAVALMLRTRFHAMVLRSSAWLFLVAVIALVFDTYITPTSATMAMVLLSLRYTILALVAAGVIGIALQPQFVSRMLSIRPMRFLGTYSYGIYVFHVILFSLLQHPLHDFLKDHFGLSTGVEGVVLGVLVFGISVACACLSYNLYERQFLQLKRFFDYRKAVH